MGPDSCKGMIVTTRLWRRGAAVDEASAIFDAVRIKMKLMSRDICPVAFQESKQSLSCGRHGHR